ncbi:MAG: DNA polymerase II large subunit [Candidatus Micrarchaeia archaeon]
MSGQDSTSNIANALSPQDDLGNGKIQTANLPNGNLENSKNISNPLSHENKIKLSQIAHELEKKITQISHPSASSDANHKISSPEMEQYFATLKKGLDEAFDMASHARAQGLDPEKTVEIKPASDVAARVEGLVGPVGIASLIRELEKSGKTRDVVAKEVVIKILSGEVIKGSQEKLIDQAVRTGVSILTEGVLVAPTEGIASIQIRAPSSGRPHDGNPDGSSYLAILFAGPIRSAGGTVAAQAVVLADVARKHFGIGKFRPTETELERYVEECNLYNDRCAHLQYKPTDDEIKHIVRNCPVCVSGEPTEKIEVSVFRDLPRMETNRVRGGIALVICEGIAQKAAKVLKYTSKIGLGADWQFLQAITKGVKKSDSGGFELKADNKFLDELVAGRPIFSYSMMPGGFRLRYGRMRCTGIAAKAIHPASMYILDSFPAIGTQLKLERPGKGTVCAPCDSIMGPIVKLKDGSVVYVNDSAQAQKICKDVSEILFLGDLLISYGDFLKSNHPLMPSGIVEEWWEQMADAKQVKYKKKISAKEAFELSRKHSLALHPLYTYFWHDISPQQLGELALWLSNSKAEFDWFGLKSLQIESAPQKRVLELLCIPHTVHGANISFDADIAYALLSSLALLDEEKKSISITKFNKIFDSKKSTLENVCAISGISIMAKAPVYIGTRMGRPEKARKREMAPPVHVLFPVGFLNKSRQIIRQYSKMRSDEKKEGRGVEVDLARLKCKSCKKVGHSLTCSYCNSECFWMPACENCGRSSDQERCVVCNGRVRFYDRRPLDLVRAVDATKKRLNLQNLPEIKGVHGMISSYKIPELLDKGFIRAKHNLSIFRDATCRFDLTDMVLTHFTPKEIHVSAKRLVQLGYTHDIHGKPLRDDNQMLSIMPQDVILPFDGAKHFFSVSKYIDELLVEVYQMRPYYNLKSEADLVGQLTIGLSPHTSAGVLSRIIGFTNAHVGFAHPYFHCAKRRNCDGDEDCLMLLMDAFLNFSTKFMPASRGGTMDSPLVLTTRIDPTEVDDEVHCMETVGSYPLSFYDATQKFASPSEAKIPTIKDILDSPAQYGDIHYTHSTTNIEDGPYMSSYISLEKKMTSKVAAEFELEDKIRAVDSADAAKRVLLAHFMPDMYGNLRSFSRQMFRCSDCNAKYRRVPLVGKCTQCNGKLLLTIYKGGIEKYLKPSRDLANRYDLPPYLKQRLDLIQKDIDSIFSDEKAKQSDLADFM